MNTKDEYHLFMSPILNSRLEVMETKINEIYTEVNKLVNFKMELLDLTNKLFIENKNAIDKLIEENRKLKNICINIIREQNRSNSVSSYSPIVSDGSSNYIRSRLVSNICNRARRIHYKNYNRNCNSDSESDISNDDIDFITNTNAKELLDDNISTVNYDGYDSDNEEYDLEKNKL